MELCLSLTGAFLPSWELLPFAYFFLAKQKVNNGMAFSNQPVLELVFDDDAGQSINKVEPRGKRFGSCNQEQLKNILGS